jgi:hypothetical protein
MMSDPSFPPVVEEIRLAIKLDADTVAMYRYLGRSF